MSQPELPPLAPDLLRLLEAERSRPVPAADMQARVRERIGASLLDIVPWPGPGGDGPLPPAPPPAPPVRLHRLPLAVGLVALGGVGGALVHAVLRPAPAVAPAPALSAPPPNAAPAVFPALPPPTPIPRAPVPPSRPAAPSRRTQPLPEPAAATPAAKPGEPLARDGELAAERALLEQARMALARGRPADALVVLSRHAREFEGGRLVEEREALMILSLVANHQTDAARVLANGFKEKYPKSMLLRTIDAAFESRP